MVRNYLLALSALVAAGVCAAGLGYGQTAAVNRTEIRLQENAVVAAPRDRVVAQIDDARVVPLRGNTHPAIRVAADLGAVNAQLPMKRMTLVLKRSAEQDAALDKFMARQLDPASPDYHHWLTPEEFGAQYGVSESDIQRVTSWLQNRGFTVDRVSNGRMFIEFSGTAGQVQATFHTQIHRVRSGVEEHIANLSDPSIPEALAPVVTGILSLHNFRSKPMHIDLGTMRRDSKTGKWMPLDDNLAARPMTTVPTDTGPAFELVSPYDFATIYNVLPLWNAGIDGTGQTIAIAGRSNIPLTDVAKFRSAFGLPAKAPVVITNGPAVTTEGGERTENLLDVEWSGAVAKNATIKFVTTESTDTSDGAAASALYIIDHKVAPVMSFSYGECELFLQTGGNAYYNSLWQQAAAQGITVFVSTGDQAAAACDGGQEAPYAANYGLAVSGLSTTPYNVAVGGTDLAWVNISDKSYWNTANNATNLSSATSYVPEVPWNGTCASLDVAWFYDITQQGAGSQEAACEYVYEMNWYMGLVNVVGGTGGKSACTTPSGDTPASCSGGYAKPSWQTGTGVPADGKRDVPDVSLFASGGTLNTAYVICDSQSNPCDPTHALAQAIGGTSASSPAMAGIMALINQKAGAPQGNANVSFYKLAARDTRASCKSSTVTAANTCNFYDVTSDNIAVPCLPGSPNCTVSSSSDHMGILNGYNSTVGYDLATGLGTVNAKNLVTNWSLVTGAPVVSMAPASLSFAARTVGTTSAAQTITLSNTGTAALAIADISITGTNYTSFGGSTTCPASLPAATSCQIRVTFKPLAAGTLAAVVSVTDNATGSPHKVTLTGTGTAAATATLLPAALTFASTVVGATSAAQAVTLKNTGGSALTGIVVAVTGTNAGSFIATSGCGTTLAAGVSCTIAVKFKPAAAGSLTATLGVTDNASNSPQHVTLTGTGAANPTLSVTPAALTFPNTISGKTSAAQMVTVKNNRTTAVTISAVSLTGTNPTSFIELNGCGASLAAGASCGIYVAFKPGSAAVLHASLGIANSTTSTPLTVALTGTGTAAPAVTLSKTALTFPATNKGTMSAAQSLTVTNSGTSTLNITNITLMGTGASSFLQVNTCGPTLAPAANCTIYVAFAPAAVGSLAANLNIFDNGTPSSQTVTLTGTGR